ncbi:MAG: hypothetical protein AAFX94_01675 [Myxococcota bacterium]
MSILLLTLTARWAAAGSEVVLEWESSPLVSDYEVEIARDRSFNDIVVRERTDRSRYVWPAFPAQVHFWRVRSVDVRGRRSRWSPARTILASPKPPTGLESTPSNSQVGIPAAVGLTWERSELCIEYRVELSRSPTFSRITSIQKTAEPSTAIQLNRFGRYYWRVVGIAPDGRETVPTQAARFTVAPSAPSATGPSTTTQFDSVTLTWQTEPGVRRWRVELESGAGSSYVKEVTSARYVHTAARSGTTRWRVTALAAGIAGPFSPWRSLQVQAATPDAVAGPLARTRKSPPVRAEVGLTTPPPEVPDVRERSPSTIQGVARMGWETNFGAVSTPLLSAGVGVSRPDWRLAIEIGYSSEESPIDDTIATTRMVPLTLALHRRWPGTRLEPYAGGAAGVRLNRISIDEERLTSTLLSAAAIAGLDIMWGPGSWFVEAALSSGAITDERTQFRETLFTVSTGFRLDVTGRERVP